MKKVARIAGLVCTVGIVIAVGGVISNQAIRISSQPKSVEIASSSPLQNGPVTIAAVGDIMLDRTVRTHIEQSGPEYPFSHIPRFFDGADIVVGNLEGSFTDNPSVSVADHTILHFTFDPKLASELRAFGFSNVSLANNHSFDFGADGFDSTVRYLDAAKIASFGSPSNDIRLSTIRWAKGKSVAFIGYHEFYNPDVSSVVDQIAYMYGKVDFIVVYPHWGVEYEKGFTDNQREIAHAFIDAGADVVIGSHPHVIEPLEIYRNKAIFYSLGNFVFDQDFSLDTKRGMTLRITFDDSHVSYSLVPITMSHAQLSLPDAEERSLILAEMSQSSDVSSEIKNAILDGSFTLDRNKTQ